MQPQFICHKDFAEILPINVYHRERKGEKNRSEEDERLLNRHILFRKEFSLDKTGNAVLTITADDYYKLYVNGSFVTSGPAASYPEGYNYNEIDVSKYLHPGRNVIAVHTYYQGLINRVWVSCDRRACFYCRLGVDGEDILVSDSSWRCCDHSGYSAVGSFGYDTAFAECYDSSAREVGFELSNFDDSYWPFASVFKNADYVLQKQSTSQLISYRAEPIQSRIVDGALVLDFGREMVGYLGGSALGKKGDKIILRYAEELDENGLPRHNMRCNCSYEEQWLLSGNEDKLEQYDYKAFRYVALIIPDGVELKDVYMTVRHYPYEERAIFDENDDEIKAILRLCLDTIKYGTQENFVDCPTREKGQYLGDVTIAARAHAIATGRTDMLRKALSDFAKSAMICKGLMAVSCCGLMQEIADYSLQFASNALFCYKLDGDKDFLRSLLPTILGVLDYFSQYEREDGLIIDCRKWNLVDWPQNLRDGYVFPKEDQPHNVLNAFWCGFLKDVDEVCVILGATPPNKAKKSIEAYTRVFFSKEKGLFCDDPCHSHSAIHSNLLPLLFSILPEGERTKKNILCMIKEKGLCSMGVYMAYFTLAAVAKCGETKLCRELIKDDGCWLNMLKEGATTTFEAWGKEQKWNTSLFHPWATAPIIILAKNSPVY